MNPGDARGRAGEFEAVMSTRRSWGRRRVLLAIVSTALLGLGPCVQIAAEAAISGFFNATTNVAVEQLEARLYADTPGESP
jgi:hypothetical protein